MHVICLAASGSKSLKIYKEPFATLIYWNYTTRSVYTVAAVAVCNPPIPTLSSLTGTNSGLNQKRKETQWKTKKPKSRTRWWKEFSRAHGIWNKTHTNDEKCQIYEDLDRGYSSWSISSAMGSSGCYLIAAAVMVLGQKFLWTCTSPCFDDYQERWALINAGYLPQASRSSENSSIYLKLPRGRIFAEWVTSWFQSFITWSLKINAKPYRSP